MEEWFTQNAQWIFSGIGLILLKPFLKIFKTNNQKDKQKSTITNNITLNNNTDNKKQETEEEFISEKKENLSRKRTITERKNFIKILFIDDDTKFQVVKILMKSGWVHTKIIKDAETLEMQEITNAHLIFVDIQKVGISMGFNDEGLGLSLALKEKYPSKKIIIYSAETNGNRFHQALQKADFSLEKNADPYQFQKLVEDLSEGYLE